MKLVFYKLIIFLLYTTELLATLMMWAGFISLNADSACGHLTLLYTQC